MAIHSERLALALDRLEAPDWDDFERLASTFLASEYPNLRTMASPSGDGGRDAALYCEDDDDSLAFQYSVTERWSPKIRSTIKRLSETFPNTKSLIYLTNRQIGADADALKKEFRRNGYFIDLYDRSWFLERCNSSVSREKISEELAKKFVDPLITRKVMDNDLAPSLVGDDAKTALIFLEMQILDSDSAYGLTKSSYDALTRAALRGTSTEKRLTRKQVYDKVQSFLPSHSNTVVQQRVAASLERLKNVAVRHRKDNDEFHLTDLEIARLSGSISHIAVLKSAFDKDVLGELTQASDVSIDNPQKFCVAARAIVESYFLKKGESFARSAIVARPHTLDEVTLRSAVSINAGLNFGISGASKVAAMTEVLQSVLGSPTEATARYLNNLRESYTLFAFLAATPDVQRATRQMFSTGDIWLDTSVILPLLSENNAPISQTTFTQVFQQCNSAGLKLLVTAGVVEEIERHINKCKSFIRMTVWDGPVPFLLANFLKFGNRETDFLAWVENFAGESDPFQDIVDYLRVNYSIRLESAAAHPNVNPALANAIRDAWQKIHIGRRENGTGDMTHALRLASHDAENYLHVLSSRIGQHGKAPLGYSDWWLTLDRSARYIMSNIEKDLLPSVNIGPVLSLDYLLGYLTFGPNREKVDLTGAAFAKTYADVLIEPLPTSMMEILDGVRAENIDVPEAIVQRRIRDKLNKERSKMGSIDSNSLESVENSIRESY